MRHAIILDEDVTDQIGHALLEEFLKLCKQLGKDTEFSRRMIMRMTPDRIDDDMAPIYVCACKCTGTEDWLCYWPANVDATYRALLSYVSRFVKEYWANSIELIYLDGSSSMLRCTNIFGMPSKNDQAVTPVDMSDEGKIQ